MQYSLVLYETVLTIACINANVIGLHTNLYRDIRIYTNESNLALAFTHDFVLLNTACNISQRS